MCGSAWSRLLCESSKDAFSNCTQIVPKLSQNRLNQLTDSDSPAKGGEETVKKVFEAAIIALILTVLLFSAVGMVSARYPGPDYVVTDPEYGPYSSYVVSAVAGYYGGQYYYSVEEYYSVRNTGSAQNNGDMYYVWFLDAAYQTGTTSQNTAHNIESYSPIGLIASYTLANFKYGGQYWSLDIYAWAQASS